MRDRQRTVVEGATGEGAVEEMTPKEALSAKLKCQQYITKKASTLAKIKTRVRFTYPHEKD